MIPRVFVSCPSVLKPDQEIAVEKWRHGLQRMGIEPIAPPSVWAEDSLWTSLRAAIDAADGVLILGFRQLRIDEGRWRPGTPASSDPATWWPTPWNHLEAGMALTARLPVLIIREDGVAGGIFDPGTWTDGVYGVELSSSPRDPAVVLWTGDVFARHGERRSVDSIERTTA